VPGFPFNLYDGAGAISLVVGPRRAPDWHVLEDADGDGGGLGQNEGGCWFMRGNFPLAPLVV